MILKLLLCVFQFLIHFLNGTSLPPRNENRDGFRTLKLRRARFYFLTSPQFRRYPITPKSRGVLRHPPPLKQATHQVIENSIFCDNTFTYFSKISYSFKLYPQALLQSQFSFCFILSWWQLPSYIHFTRTLITNYNIKKKAPHLYHPFDSSTQRIRFHIDDFFFNLFFFPRERGILTSSIPSKS